MRQFVAPFIRYLEEEKNLSASTVSSYQRDLGPFMEFLEQQDLVEPDKVSRALLVMFISRLKQDGKAPATITRSVVTLRSFFHFLVRDGVLSHNPALLLDMPRQDKKLPVVLTTEEMEQLLKAPDLSTVQGSRDRAMLELLYASGIRVTELVSLNDENVRLDLKYVHCRAADGKERIVPIGGAAVYWIQQYEQEARPKLVQRQEVQTDPALFLNMNGKRMSRQGFWKLLKKYAADAGINKEITPHTLRHTFAVHMLDRGADIRSVQELLGNSDHGEPLLYRHVPRPSMKEVYDRYHPRAGMYAPNSHE
ncbi:site-specific tyrosine recombinase XerD [Paenibacillus sp. JX-17]|uniref:Tyrosine recombinase XerC n=1 Tax=Paenibacillus lacisoli TaxID=3064525 RepID=A0ABT9C794_9BACL|nr:site-specific tyrosine recombinase XerD [Paenibacillus sp. JX-17]MDO7905132.1 site-specific tyrosine recombinase XerD [Paenibacillus sp. JX-17]